ncbi:iron-sulfur cluster assembly scaffold protein [Methanomicrobiaceae archaeon CYW5]|uniref:iron-sulfur cluster assembly scaffold protein n=1 Tax=Methanovulcanius yangii TaxID=1789227 RepID=UPI0029C9D730|nr:iron-sulfur cluster assembly scaffold protein [Methanovulcanius yangii]MBT8507443.1 iron-sulfur cluster assembly scaffold protein [Methanovulcanius yangii]
MYNETVMDHFEHPRNVGDMEDATVVADVGSPECGDRTKLYLKIEDNVIVDVSFKTLGCAAAIASSSKATEMIKGKTLEEAWALTNMDVVEALGGLPEPKIHCSVLAEGAIREAINTYRKDQGLVPWE